MSDGTSAQSGEVNVPPPHSGGRDAEQFRLLVEQVREYAIFLLDPDGTVATWNDGAARIKGYAADEIIGAHFSRFYPHEAVASGRPGRALAEARASGQFEDEGWRVRRDGTRFWASVVITAIHADDGSLTGFAKVTRDLTERRNAEAEREQRLRELRCLHAVSEEIRADLPFDELVARVARRIPCGLAAPERARVSIRLDECARTDADESDGGKCLEEPIEVHGTTRGEIVVTYPEVPGGTDREPFTAEERATVRSVATALGETAQRKHKERELVRYTKELESFSYSVSHDLRAPLRALDGFSQALLEKYPDALDERGRDYLQRIRRASQRMSHLIDALLRLSRLSRQPMQWRPTDLSTLAREVFADLRAADPGREIELRCEPGLRVWGDAPLLRIVLQNLLGNAWKFTAGVAHPVIELGRDPKRFQRFHVRDNGAGFDLRYVDRLFGAFQRLHSEAEFKGTGIGLVTVKRIVLRHGGDVGATGTPGGGATFWFELEPAARADMERKSDGAAQDDPAGRG